MLNEISGKTGYMIFAGNEVPIYAHILSATRERTNYRTANTDGYPTRNSGLINEEIVIRGVTSEPAQTWVTTANTGALNFEIGWNDLVALNRKQVDVYATLHELRVDFNYFSSPLPSFQWTANFSGVINNKKILIGILDIDESSYCAQPLCNKLITTTDSTLNWNDDANSGTVLHVRRASIFQTISRLGYATANSANHHVSTSGVPDRIVELEIEGDFDYWLNLCSFEDIKRNYRFYTAPGLFWTADNMKVMNISNIMVNIQTGEIISASVQLGASYGD